MTEGGNDRPRRLPGRRELAALLESFAPLLGGRDVAVAQANGQARASLGSWSPEALAEVLAGRSGEEPWTIGQTRCYPLWVEGEWLATLVVRADPAADPVVEQTLGHSLALFLSQVMEKQAVANETLDRYRELSLLYRVSQTIGASLNPEMIPRLVLDESNRVIPAEAGLVVLFSGEESRNGQGADWKVVADFGRPEEVGLLDQLVPAVLARVGDSDRPLILTELPAASLSHGPLLWAPLKTSERVLGGILLARPPGRTVFTASEEKLLLALAVQSAFAMENAHLIDNLQRILGETLEMKSLMDDIFASIPSGVITTDLQQKVMLFNQAAERILGLAASEVVGRPLAQVLPELVSPLQAALEDGALILDEELSPLLPRRGQIHLRLSCTPLYDAHRAAKGLTVVINDVTEQRRLEVDRERIHRTLGLVVAPRVRDRLLADPGNLRLDGVRQPVTVLFADVFGFTPFSEQTEPETLFKVLNSYLSLAAQAVLEQEGTLDKFMGDAVMALWNAPDTQPDHTLRAVLAALAMKQALQSHRLQLGEHHQLHFSIGINTGEAMVGNVGTDELFNYTAIGDTVNLAQRLESIAEPGQILLSEAAYRAVAGQVVARKLAPVKVKGRRQSVMVYELEGLAQAHGTEDFDRG
ncbi:MAG: PAS domain-containing protein [Chloroflexi bacterium]|nr:PAS domain-containing protein [Chloroflexota bacterium]MCI0577261.1 PAS domain-containing protein [Chloroflexota bacterium]MCI0646742.1 PAS domain-containing protein [Chloroflexota bacterium]MCI0731376.1 PAS domain-containing protein [Chloroflexota bacterium]